MTVDEIFRKSIKFELLFYMLLFPILFFLGKILFCMQMFLGSSWMSLNLFFTSELLEMVLRRNLSRSFVLIVLIKFPVLCGVGIMFLLNKSFDMYGILIGTGVAILSIGGSMYGCACRASR